ETRDLDVAAAKLEAFSADMDRKLQPAGTAFVRLGERGEIAFSKISSTSAKTQADLDNLAARMRGRLAEMGDSLEAGAQAFFRVSQTGEVVLPRLTQSMSNTGAAFTGLASSFSSLGPAVPSVTVALVAFGAALALILAPLAAYTAGLAATLTLTGGLIGFAAALGAASIALTGHARGWFDASENLAKAQAKVNDIQQQIKDRGGATVDQLAKLKDAQAELAKATEAADNPWTRFTNRIQQAGQALGEQTAPAAGKLLQ